MRKSGVRFRGLGLKEALNKWIPLMSLRQARPESSRRVGPESSRRAHHERNRSVTVRPELAEGLRPGCLKKALKKPSPFGRRSGEGPSDRSVAQATPPDWRFHQSLLNVPVVLLAIWSGSAGADDYGITANELKQMPGMCRALSESHYAEDAKNLRNPSLYPNGFTSVHHFCDGLKYLLRADKSSDAQSKGGNLQEAIGNFDYVLSAKEHKAASAAQVRTYHAMTRFYKAEALKRAGRTSEMVAEYMKVTQLKPDYPHAYAQLFDYYLKTGDRDEAAKVIAIGLKHAPKSNLLLKRKAKLK